MEFIKINYLMNDNLYAVNIIDEVILTIRLFKYKQVSIIINLLLAHQRLTTSNNFLVFKYRKRLGK